MNHVIRELEISVPAAQSLGREEGLDIESMTSRQWFSQLYLRNAAVVAKSLQLCPTVTPETAAHQAPPSLGFSRQEHWSGLPFPSPMHESEN